MPHTAQCVLYTPSVYAKIVMEPWLSWNLGCRGTSVDMEPWSSWDLGYHGTLVVMGPKWLTWNLSGLHRAYVVYMEPWLPWNLGCHRI